MSMQSKEFLWESFNRKRAGVRHPRAQLRTATVAPPSRRRVPAASRCANWGLRLMHAAWRRPNPPARTPTLRFCPAGMVVMSSCAPRPPQEPNRIAPPRTPRIALRKTKSPF